MTVADRVGSLWKRFGWTLWVGTTLSILSLLELTERPALEWLGVFGVVGAFACFGLLRILPEVNLPLALFTGVIAYIAFWAPVLFLGSRVIVRSKRRRALAR